MKRSLPRVLVRLLLAPVNLLLLCLCFPFDRHGRHTRRVALGEDGRLHWSRR